MNHKPKIVILAFSPIDHDARVLRQVEYLSPHYSITVVGYGTWVPTYPDVQMISIPLIEGNVWSRRLRTLFLLPLGRLFPKKAYESWYWGRKNHQAAYQISESLEAQIIHANDWNALPVAVRAAEKKGWKIVLDLHEYATHQSDDAWHWRTFVSPMIDYFLKSYNHQASAYITVNETISRLFVKDYNFQSIVVMNAPTCELSPGYKPINPNTIRLVHHGIPLRDRKLELMIKALSYTDKRFTLTFMLTNEGHPYISDLKKLAMELVPGRVSFEKAAPPEDVVNRIADYDIGFYLLPPTNLNNMVALPNKFFEFINAGLAICIGPSTEMAQLTRQYGVGVVSNSFEPKEVAAALNNLSASEINGMKQRSIEARKVLNADVEMGKLVRLYSQLERVNGYTG